MHARELVRLATLLVVMLVLQAVLAQRLGTSSDPALRAESAVPEDTTARAESRDTELPLATRLQQVSALLLVSTAGVPSQLPWPVAGKSVKDIYLAFAPSEDAVK